MAQDAPESTNRDEARRKLMLRGGVVAGGMAAFAAGYGETVRPSRAWRKTGAATAHAVRGNSGDAGARGLRAAGRRQRLEGRATSCGAARPCWNSCSPYRVLQPLKRVGPRGAGKWQTISFEQLVQEACEGGDRSARAMGRPARDLRPRDAAGSGQPGVRRQGQPVPRSPTRRTRAARLIQRFAGQSFGTVNFGNHGSYCGQSSAWARAQRWRPERHAARQPDWDNARFGLFIGAAPAQAGNPFQRRRQLAGAHAAAGRGLPGGGRPVPASSSLSAGSGNEWVPVNPPATGAGDGLIRWIPG